jgi:hypothetical protein
MRLGRQAAVFALVVALILPWAAAAEPRPADRGLGERTALSAPALLSHLWGFLTGLWEAAGAIADPLGKPQATTDAGAILDPLGNPQPTADAGSSLEPLG